MPNDNAVSCTLKLRGELTVRTIADAHQKLVAAFEQNDAVTIDARKAGEIDLTFVQLVEAARRGTTTGKRVTLAMPHSKTLRTVLERGGYLSAGDSVSFWQKGE